MKVNNTTVFLGDDSKRIRNSKVENGKVNPGKSVDGSFLNGPADPIAARREEARKKGMRIMKKAMAGDFKVDESLKDRHDRIRSLETVKSDATAAIDKIEDDRAKLRATYRVSEDSDEEKDMKLLEKEIKSQMPGSNVTLTDEDREAIKKIKDREEGLTEYQERSLDLLKSETSYAREIYEANANIDIENRIIAATELEKLKNHAMATARRQIEALGDQASREIVGMIVDEAKENLDADAREVREQAQKAEEKKEELEERIDKAKEKRREEEKLTEAIIEGSQTIDSVSQDINSAQAEIKDMMSKMKLIEEDIKGAAVDKVL